MIVAWIPRGLVTGFAVLATLAGAGPAVPAEAVNGTAFVPPTGWPSFITGRSVTYNDTARRSCSLIISASHIAIREGGHRALFERYNQEIGDRLKLDIGATDEETATLQGLAKDGSEILLRNRILRSPNQTIKLQILLANKYGIGATFVGISLANLVSCNPPTGVDSSPPTCSSGLADCSDELDDTLYGNWLSTTVRVS
jgi:hypothetical protein